MIKKNKIIGILLIAIGVLLPLLSFTTSKIESINEAKEITKKISLKNEYFAILEIPSIKLKKELYNLKDKRNNVNKNILVHEKSIFPNNSNSNIILASHSGNGSNAFFKNLYKLKLGDIAKIYYNNQIYEYKIAEIEYQNKTGHLYLKENKNNSLVLITCTFNNENTQTVYYANLYNIKNIS